MTIHHTLEAAEAQFDNDGGYLFEEWRPMRLLDDRGRCLVDGVEKIWVVLEHDEAVDQGYEEEYLASTEVNGWRNFKVSA